MEVDREARDLGEPPREVPRPAREGASRPPFGRTGRPTTSRPTSRSRAAAVTVGGRLGVAPPGDDADRDDDRAALVGDGEADPLLAEVDREDAHGARIGGLSGGVHRARDRRRSVAGG